MTIKSKKFRDFAAIVGVAVVAVTLIGGLTAAISQSQKAYYQVSENVSGTLKNDVEINKDCISEIEGDVKVLYSKWDDAVDAIKENTEQIKELIRIMLEKEKT